MTVTSLKEHLAGLAGLPDDLFIGSLLFYRVSNCSVTRQQLDAWFVELGLDPAYVPAPINTADAFMKAVNKDNWRLSYPMGDAGMKANILIRDVKTDKERIVKAIQREVVDANAEKLQTNTIGEAVFYKAPASRMRVSLHPTMLAQGEAEVLNPALDAMKAKYADFCVHYDPQAIRMMIRNYVTDLNAVLVNPSGGLYFVHKTRDATLDKLNTLMKRIGGDCLFELIPLVNTPDKRDMLLEASQTATEKQCRELLDKVQAKLGGKAVKLSDWKSLRDEMQMISARAEEYSNILGVAQDRAAMSLEAVTLSITALFDKVSV
ncbi:MAG: DUF6744 family protein [Oryzihumus sp.]